MKRCPQCLFLFPDSDEKCDFDQTPLEVVDDSALEAATTRPKTQPKKRRARPVVAAAVALVLGVLGIALYFGLSRQSQKASAATESATNALPVATLSLVTEESKPSTSLSPLLYDLTSLQRDANSRFGFSAKNTLAIAQSLYERHKVLTYPRTDSRALPEDYPGTVKSVMEMLGGTG